MSILIDQIIKKRIEQLIVHNEQIKKCTGFSTQEFNLLLEECIKNYPEFAKDSLLKLFYNLIHHKYYLSYPIITKLLNIDSDTAKQWNTLLPLIKILAEEKVGRSLPLKGKRIQSINALYKFCPFLEELYLTVSNKEIQKKDDSLVPQKSQLNVDEFIKNHKEKLAEINKEKKSTKIKEDSLEENLPKKDLYLKFTSLNQEEISFILEKNPSLNKDLLGIILIMKKYNISSNLIALMFNITVWNLRKSIIAYYPLIKETITIHYPHKSICDLHPLPKVSTEGAIYKISPDLLTFLEERKKGISKDSFKGITKTNIAITLFEKTYPEIVKDATLYHGSINYGYYNYTSLIFVVKENTINIYVENSPYKWELLEPYLTSNKQHQKKLLQNQIAELTKKLKTL